MGIFACCKCFPPPIICFAFPQTKWEGFVAVYYKNIILRYIYTTTPNNDPGSQNEFHLFHAQRLDEQNIISATNCEVLVTKLDTNHNFSQLT